METAASSPTKKRWFKRIAWALGIALVLYCSQYSLWVGYLLATGPFGGKEVIHIDTSCGNGEYRITVYQYRNGDGYLELGNKAGKVFATARYANGEDTPFRWEKDCKKVMVGSVDGLVFLEVK